MYVDVFVCLFNDRRNVCRLYAGNHSLKILETERERSDNGMDAHYLKRH